MTKGNECGIIEKILREMEMVLVKAGLELKKIMPETDGVNPVFSFSIVSFLTVEDWFSKSVFFLGKAQVEKKIKTKYKGTAYEEKSVFNVGKR